MLINESVNPEKGMRDWNKDMYSDCKGLWEIGLEDIYRSSNDYFNRRKIKAEGISDEDKKEWIVDHIDNVEWLWNLDNYEELNPVIEFVKDWGKRIGLYSDFEVPTKEMKYFGTITKTGDDEYKITYENGEEVEFKARRPVRRIEKVYLIYKRILPVMAISTAFTYLLYACAFDMDDVHRYLTYFNNGENETLYEWLRYTWRKKPILKAYEYDEKEAVNLVNDDIENSDEEDY